MNSFFDLVKPLYVLGMRENNSCNIPFGFCDIAKKVLKKLGWKTKITGIDCEFNIVNIEKNNKIMIGLSGGLDSVYHICNLKNAGYDVIACHIKGINNQSGVMEYEQSKKITKLLEIKLITIEFNSPKQDLSDNPFKNQLILSLMLDAGIKQGIYRYGLGCDWCTTLAESVNGFTLTDSVEVNKEFWKEIKNHFEQAELIFIDGKVTKAERIKYLCVNYNNIFKEISSCVYPHRFRKYQNKIIKEKYGVNLYDSRCGKCYKCSMEYLLLCELGLIEVNTEYYNKCWENLAKSTTSHRKDLFNLDLTLEQRRKNLLNYGS